MKIAIVGAGVVGVSTAYELANAGHDVTVYEKNAASSEEASFANGGIHSTSFTLPLSGTHVPGNRLMRLIQSTRELSHARWAMPTNARWLWSRSARQTTGASNERTAFGQAMARWGLEISDDWILRNQWEVEQSEGQLILLRNESDLDHYTAALKSLKESEHAYRVLDRTELESVEPALHGVDGIFKAIYMPGDRIMNCRQFALLTKQAAQRNGARMLFDTEVTAVIPQAKPQVRLGTGEVHVFDQVVMCTQTPLYGKVLHWESRAPMACIDSYALSVSVRESLNAPRSAIQDHQSGITVSRIGKRLRVCGGAELNRSGRAVHDMGTVNKLFRTLDQYFPGAANYPAGTQIWRGSRTFTVDGLPLVGSAGVPGVWLNLAHGANGWTLATASARLLSEQIVGKTPVLPSEMIHPDRYNR